MSGAADPGDDLTGKSWKSQAWLDSFPLDRRTAIAYFSESIFYDSECNNEIARKQFMDPTRIANLPPGIEYVVTEAQEPHLFVICKQRRSATDSIPKAFYYILDGTVYQAPTLHQVLASRMNRCKWNMREAFAKLKAHLDPLTRVKAKLEEFGASGSAEAEAEKPSTAALKFKALTADQKQQAVKVENIIFNVLRKYPMPEAPKVKQEPLAQAQTQAQAAVKPNASKRAAVGGSEGIDGEPTAKKMKA